MIHKEGFKIITVVLLLLIVLNGLLDLLLALPQVVQIFLAIASLLFFLFVLRFFRKPHRQLAAEENVVYSPADGKIVAIEETTEEEYLKEKRIQVSIFMSVWDVHLNFIPISGKLKFYRYHPGEYLVARHPKSSVLNERNTIVIENERGVQILLRQIAGFVARKISFFCKEGDSVRLGDEMGFIKFGSRVDVFLPPGSEILVNLGVHVTGKKTPLARLK